MKPSGIIYQYTPLKKASRTWAVGLGLLALSLGGMFAPLYPMIRLETTYLATKGLALRGYEPQAVPAVFSPLTNPDGSSIEPVDRAFGIVIPKIGVNAKIIPGVNPAKPGEYLPALLQGIAHASTSFLPDQDGTTYLFSHSTNYDWFVQDLNAVFYLLKNLEEKDMVVLFYKDKEYVYRITEKRIVSPSAVSYLMPQKGAKKLILQTCWPPGSTSQRLLIFADLVTTPGQSI